MPQLARPLLVRLQVDDVLAGAERVGRARHRLDGDGAPPPLDLRQRVPRVHHQVREPRRRPRARRRWRRRGRRGWPRPGRRPSRSKVVYAVSRTAGPDEARRGEVAVGALDRGQRAGGQPAVVEVEGVTRRHAQDGAVHRLGPGGQIRVEPEPERDQALVERAGPSSSRSGRRAPRGTRSRGAARRDSPATGGAGAAARAGSGAASGASRAASAPGRGWRCGARARRGRPGPGPR